MHRAEGLALRGIVITGLLLVSGGTAAAQPQMLQVTGGNGYVAVPHQADLVPATGLTVEAWFYFDTSGPGGSNYPTIVRKNPGSESYILRTGSGSGGQFQWIFRLVSGGLNSIQSSTQVPVNSWHHVAATYDGSVARLILDGQQLAQGNFPGAISSTGGELHIAQGQDSGETWKGRIDALRIWSVARTPAEIQSTMGLEITSGIGLVAAWTFNGTYQDSAGTHHGTQVGTVALTPTTCPVVSSVLQAPVLAAIGTAVTYQLSTFDPFTPYIFDATLSGSSPGLPLPAPLPGPIPLNPPLLGMNLGPMLPPGIVQGFIGFTNAAGLAFPSISVPPLPSLAGSNLHAAFITLSPAAPYGIGMVGNGVLTHVTAVPPQINSVTPTTVPSSGGTPVVIAGANFQAGATVQFGTANATGVQAIGPGTIVCTTPPGAPGAAAVRVANPDGQTAILNAAVTYVPAFTVTAVAPLTGAPGTPIVVSGSGFTTGTILRIGGAPVSPLTILPGTITFSMPAGAPCTTVLTVIGPGGLTYSTPFNPAPLIVQTVGAAGPAAGGGTFFILGSHFYPGTQVLVGGAPASIASLSSTAITVTAPPGAVGTATVQVTSAAGCSASTSYAYQ